MLILPECVHTRQADKFVDRDWESNRETLACTETVPGGAQCWRTFSSIARVWEWK